MNIFLMGFMGSGKSSVGRRLASQLDFEFIDSDEAIAKKAGKDIPRIFEDEGESGFRAMESGFLQQLDCQNTVISLGGGTPCSSENIQLIKEKGKSIYLAMEAGALLSRLIKSKTKRPLVEQFGDDHDSLLDFIQQKLAEREQFYSQADIHLDGMSIDADKLNQIVQLIRASG